MSDHTVTRVSAVPKRVYENQIEVDGEPFAVLSDRDVRELGLAEGRRLTARELESIKQREGFARARIEALNYVSRRARSRREVLERLREYSDEIATRVVDDLTTEGVLDDRKLARDLCEGKLAYRPLGPDRLRADLFKRKIPREVIEDTIVAAFETSDEVELATEALHKIAPRYTSKPGPVARKKISDALRRRGFSWDAIRTVVDRFIHG
jgi:regulatory protein